MMIYSNGFLAPFGDHRTNRHPSLVVPRAKERIEMTFSWEEKSQFLKLKMSRLLTD